jgi:hypothetical protein
MSEADDNSIVKDALMDFRASLRIVSTLDRIERFKEVANVWKNLPSSEKGNMNNAVTLMTLLTNSRCGERSSDCYNWTGILDDEIIAVSVDACNCEGINAAELIDNYANRALKPLAKTKSYLSPSGLLGGVRITAKLIRAHAKRILSKEAEPQQSKTPEYLETLITCQLLFLEKISMSGPSASKQLSAAGRMIQNMLFRWPETSHLRKTILFPAYVKLITNDKSDVEMTVGLCFVYNALLETESTAGEVLQLLLSHTYRVFDLITNS